MWSRFNASCSRAGLLISVSSFFLLVLASLFRSSPPLPICSSWNSPRPDPAPDRNKLNVFVTDLPREFNYGLLDQYWDFESTKKGKQSTVSSHKAQFPPYSEDPLIKQYSAEYWLLGDLMTPEDQRSTSVARRVWNSSEADIIFVPFFATLSAELQLHKAKGKFRYKKDNDDYDRQVRVVEIVKNSSEWRRSGGRDHVFVLTDPVAMWHVRAEIAPAVLLVVDFGGWYIEDSTAMEAQPVPSDIIPHRQVSLLKDVIVPYTHLLATLHHSKDSQHSTLLYFKGARHRHRTGLVRDKLWAVLEHEPGVVLEEGFPNITGQEQALSGMRNSEFCLHPAGDTPTSCRLFDAIASLCIPVIVSDNIELPFEGMLEYTDFCVFVAVHEALQPNFLVEHLKAISINEKKNMRGHLAEVQHMFEYDSGSAGGVGPIMEEGAVNLIWKKIVSKIPNIKEAISRERRKPLGISVAARCQCL